jgi:hypothetical protein
MLEILEPAAKQIEQICRQNSKNGTDLQQEDLISKTRPPY